MTPLSIGHLMEFDRGLQQHEEKTEGEEEILIYLAEQAAVRVAEIGRIIESMPEELLQSSEHMERLVRHYQGCIDELNRIIPKQIVDNNHSSLSSKENNRKHVQDLSDVVDRAARGKRLGFDMMCVSRGIRDVVRRQGGPDQYFGSTLQREIDAIVHKFNTVRIGVRLLNDMIKRAIDANNASPFSAVGRGVLHQKLSLRDEIERAATFVESVAIENLYVCPEIQIQTERENDDQRDDVTNISYVPAHVWYIVVEVLKNAVVAVVDRDRDERENGARSPPGVLPPIDVRIRCTPDRTTVSVVDRGVGLGDNVENAMAYCFTTGTRPAGNDLSGAGIGLPMAFAYAEYFGGSLSLRPNDDDGEGCIVNIELCHDMDAPELQAVLSDASAESS